MGRQLAEKKIKKALTCENKSIKFIDLLQRVGLSERLSGIGREKKDGKGYFYVFFEMVLIIDSSNMEMRKTQREAIKRSLRSDNYLRRLEDRTMESLILAQDERWRRA